MEWLKLAQIAGKLFKNKDGGLSIIKIIITAVLLIFGSMMTLAVAVAMMTATTAGGLSGKVQYEPMDTQEQQDLTQQVGKWEAPYGDYMASPPTSPYNQDTYSSLQNMAIEGVAVPFKQDYIDQLQNIGNPLLFMNNQHVGLSFGLIKSLEVITGIDPKDSIPKLQPSDLQFTNVNITATAKVIVRYEPQTPYWRATDDNGNPTHTIYQVKAGDTYDSLAQQYHETKEQIADDNNLWYQVQEKDANGNPVNDANGNPVYVPQLDSNGNIIVDSQGNPTYTKAIRDIQVNMPLKLTGMIYTPPDKAIYETKTFTYPVKVLSHVQTYNGKHDFTYDTQTINEDIQTVNAPSKQNRVVDADGQKETLTVQMPVFKDEADTDDYTVLDDMLVGAGLSSDDDQLIVYREAMAYDPSFADKKANSALATEIMQELSDMGAIDSVDLGSLNGVFCGQVPAQYLPYYQGAGQKYNIPWVILASIHEVETGFGTSKTMVSSAGAVGQMQFMPQTWVGWSAPSGADITDPATIARYHGYGVDANNDGKADPYDPQDAIYTAGKYLQANGGSTNIHDGIYAYNHAEWYVTKVLTIAQQILNGGTACSGSGGTPPIQTSNQAIKNAIQYGYSLVGRTQYVWGGGRTQDSRDRGDFDCSSFVWWAYYKGNKDATGTPVDINGGCSDTGYCGVSTHTLDVKGQAVDYSNIQVGDLVFFDTGDGADSHVGIYIGNDQFIDCENSYGVHIATLHGNSYWWSAFTAGGSHVRRLVQGS